MLVLIVLPSFVPSSFSVESWSLVLGPILSARLLTLENSLQFNIVCKHLGAERMSFFLNEAAGDIRDMLLPSLELPKAKL